MRRPILVDRVYLTLSFAKLIKKHQKLLRKELELGILTMDTQASNLQTREETYMDDHDEFYVCF